MAQQGSPSSNIYTILVLAALLALVVAVAYLWVRSGQLFGTTNPFEIVNPGNARALLAGVLLR
jgi:hypothetical protein